MFSNCGVISKTAAHGAMDGEEDEEVGIGQDWIWFDVEKECGEEEGDIVLDTSWGKVLKNE